MSIPDPNKTNIFNAYLAEYNTLRTEVLARISTQNQCFNFLLIIVGASITAIITTANSNNPANLRPVTFAIALLLPLITCPLAYMFFDNELMIHAIGSYLYWDRRVRFIELTKDDAVFKSITDFRFLPPSTLAVFRPISRGRWYLFCIPTFLPVLFLPVYTIVKWASLPHYSRLIYVTVAIIFLLDILEVYILARVITWIFDNDAYQHRLTAEAGRLAKSADLPEENA
jgi:hypothetical protein